MKEGRINSYVASGGEVLPHSPPTRRGLLSVTDAPSLQKTSREMKKKIDKMKTKNRGVEERASHLFRVSRQFHQEGYDIRCVFFFRWEDWARAIS